MPFTPPHDTQPLPNADGENNREYVEATWATGTGGHPKTAGGESVSKSSGGTRAASRGLNRKDQRYAQPEATLISNRQARAAIEISATVVRRGDNGIFAVRGASGNHYHVNDAVTTCDCPDFWRLRASGYTMALCKHCYIVQQAITAAGGVDNLPVSPRFVASFLGIEIRTVQKLCEEGMLPYTKVNGCIVITWDIATQDAVAEYHAGMIMPGDDAWKAVATAIPSPP